MKAAYFDMIEYFCNSHDDVAVDVIQYDCNDKEIFRKAFSLSTGCGEVTSDDIWKQAKNYSDKLMQEGIRLRNERKI